jgi:predicted enzyme related to lactoylglutathione lyase
MQLRAAYTVVAEMDRALAFYGAVLGTPPLFRDGDRWCQFRLGGGDFALSAPAEAAPGAQGSIVVFETDNLDAAAEKVVAAGGRVLGGRDMGSHGRLLHAADPDGNPFQIFAKQAAG